MIHRLPFALILALGLLPSMAAQRVDVYSRPQRAERTRQYDVLHYRIQLKFDEGRRSFQGETQITLRPLNPGFDTCVLDAETFRVSGVKGERNEQLAFEQTPGKLTIHLGREFSQREKVILNVSYSAIEAVDPERYGMPKGYGLGLGFKNATADHPQLINTLSFPEGARHWFPCYDHPNDKATSELIATVKAKYQVISNGKLVSATAGPAPGEKTFHWKQDQPHSTYLFVLVAGPYVKVADSLGTLPLAYWVYEKDARDARRSFARTPEIIEYFNQELGYPYPWPKYDQIAIPEFGGGAESTNATVIGDGTIHDAKADKDFPSHWLVAHEAAHQWWGNLLTMRDWSHTWLNESFATYSEYLYSKHSLGDDEGALNLLAKKDQYLKEAHERYQRPIVFDHWYVPNDNFDRHTYQKGAVVLAMLRSLIGDEPFRRAISTYLGKYAFQSVTTRQFTDVVRDSSGQDLDWFFEQWLYRPGHPVFAISYTWDGSKVKLKVAQTQDMSGRIPVFRVPVTIGITTASGKRSHPVWLRQREELIELACSEKPLLVRFDEGNHLLKEWTFRKGKDELLYQLGHDDVIGRMDAARELSGLRGDDDVAAGLRKSAATDAFWAVRRDAVLALGTVPAAADVAFLKERAADSASAVRVAALRVLGDRKDSSLVPFLKARFEAEDSYLAQAEAVRSLGKCDAQGQLTFLQKTALMKSPNNVIRNAASSAITRAGK